MRVKYQKPDMFVIVDMQPEFDASFNCRSAVLRQLEHAKKRGDQVVILEYANYGPSYQEIYEALRGYGYVQVTKEEDGGGPAMLAANVIRAVAGDRGRRTIRIVGVNTCFCVRDTALDLVRMGHNVKPLLSACSCYHQEREICNSRLRESIYEEH